MTDDTGQKKRIVITVIILAGVALAAFISAFFKNWG